MALKDIANADYTKQLQVLVGTNPTGNVTDTGTPSSKVKAAGKGVLKDGYGLSVSNITDPGAGASIPDPGPYNVSFSATAMKVKAENTLVLRKDDETGVINATPQIPGTPNVPFPVAFKFVITDAGQVKVKAQ